MSHPDPTLVPRAAPLDLAGLGVAAAAPFLLDMRIARDQIADEVDHVTNVEYVRWLDRAAEMHADAVGFTRARMLEGGVMWFVARHEIDYVAEARLGDHLVIATWVREFRRVKTWRDYVIVRPADATIVCRASTLWVLVNLATRRPVRIPDFVRVGLVARPTGDGNACGTAGARIDERGDPSCTSL